MQTEESEKGFSRTVDELELSAPVTVHVDHPLTEAKERLDRSGQSVLVVLDGDEIVGTLSAHEMISESRRIDERPSTLRVQDVMDHCVAHCVSDQSLESVLQEMIATQSQLVVITDTDGQIKGVLTAGDLTAIAPDSATKERIAQAVAEARRVTPLKKSPTGGRRPSGEPGTKPTYSEKPHMKDD